MLVGPTRGSRSIDRTFSNLDEIRRAGVINPLQTEGDDGHVRNSDHNVTYVAASLPRRERFKWLTYSYRYNDKDAAEEFGKWLVANDWEPVLRAQGSEEKTKVYQAMIERAISDSIMAW